MKKLFIVFLTSIVAASLLSGCGMLAKANGVILYGAEQDIIDIVKQDNDIIEEDQYSIKLLENNGQQIMVFTEDTARALVKKQLIREITDQEKGKTKVVTSLGNVAKGEGLLFAKKSMKEINIGEESMNVDYKGNLIIGEGRVFTDMFLIVNEADWDSIKGTEKSMAVLKYDKDPSADGLSYDVEKTQLVRIEK